MTPEKALKKRGRNYIIDIYLSQVIADAINDGKRRLRVSTSTANYAAAHRQARDLIRKIEDAESTVITASASSAYAKTMKAIRDSFGTQHDTPEGPVSTPELLLHVYDETDPEYIAALDSVKGTDHRAQMMTLWDVYTQVLSTGTINRPEVTERVIKEYGIDRTLADCTPGETLKWLQALAETNAQTTLKQKLSNLNVVWSSGVDVLGIVPPQLPNPFKPRLLKSVVSKAAARVHTKPVDRPLMRYWIDDKPEREHLFKTCYLLGLRANETANVIRCSDGIEITKSKTKSGLRVLPIHRDMTDEDVDRLVATTSTQAEAFRQRITHMKKSAAHRRSLQALDGLDPRLNTHSMRTACAHNLTLHECPVEIVAWILGHSQAQSTTQGYIGKARPLEIMSKYLNLTRW